MSQTSPQNFLPQDINSVTTKKHRNKDRGSGTSAPRPGTLKIFTILTSHVRSAPLTQKSRYRSTEDRRISDISWDIGYNLKILGKVLLTVQPSKKISAFSSYFYINNKLALSVDALLGLNTMRELGILISPDSNEIIYEGKPLKGMSNPFPMAFLDSPLTGEQTLSPIVAK